MLFVYPAIFHKEDESYWVEFPDLKGCNTYGSTIPEAMEMAQEALGGYLLSLLEHGDNIASPSDISAIHTLSEQGDTRCLCPLRIESQERPVMNTIIRDASLEDAERILEIYGYYVKNTAITFEYDVPTLPEFQERIKNTRKRYPYLVIEQDGIIQGYAYAGAFIGRAACDWSCETTVQFRKE